MGFGNNKGGSMRTTVLHKSCMQPYRQITTDHTIQCSTTIKKPWPPTWKISSVDCIQKEEQSEYQSSYPKTTLPRIIVTCHRRLRCHHHPRRGAARQKSIMNSKADGMLSSWIIHPLQVMVLLWDILGSAGRRRRRLSCCSPITAPLWHWIQGWMRWCFPHLSDGRRLMTFPQPDPASCITIDSMTEIINEYYYHPIIQDHFAAVVQEQEEVVPAREQLRILAIAIWMHMQWWAWTWIQQTIAQNHFLFLQS